MLSAERFFTTKQNLSKHSTVSCKILAPYSSFFVHFCSFKNWMWCDFLMGPLSSKLDPAKTMVHWDEFRPSKALKWHLVDDNHCPSLWPKTFEWCTFWSFQTQHHNYLENKLKVFSFKAYLKLIKGLKSKELRFLMKKAQQITLRLPESWDFS